MRCGARTSGLVAVCLLAVGVAGCGGDVPTRTLTHADVTGVPAGSATGTTFSGQFLVTSNQLEGCHCRSGSCAGLHGSVGETLQAVERDGSFEFDQGGVIAQGGIDADGTYHVGSSLEQPGNIQYALIDGHVATAAGAPTGLTFTQYATGQNGGLDCDIVSSGQARFVGPPGAATAFSEATTASLGARGLGVSAAAP
ncbi:MAG TPA: hypothetical protein VHL80_07290 [Polyangia bacterium]|nr:hypothetical protein [Polyangia bacterium]